MSNFSGAQIPWINFNITVPVQPDVPKCLVEEFPHAVRFSGGNHIVIRLRLLKHQPHRFYIVARVAAVPPRLEVAHVESGLQTELDPSRRPRDLSAKECLTTPRRFVVG